jgi:hypothetical protein
LAAPPTPLGTFAEMFGGVLLSFCQATLIAFAGAAGVVPLQLIVCAIEFSPILVGTPTNGIASKYCSSYQEMHTFFLAKRVHTCGEN